MPQPYRKTVAVRLLERLAMKDSVPGRDVQDAGVVGAEPVRRSRCSSATRTCSTGWRVPYKVDKKGRSSRSTELPPESISASTGRRLDGAGSGAVRRGAGQRAPAARGDAGGRVDQRASAATARLLPTGLGWFVQRYNGETVVWHFGLTPNGYSSLILKIPAKRAHAHPARQQRRPELLFRPSLGRRHQVALCRALPAPVWLEARRSLHVLRRVPALRRMLMLGRRSRARRLAVRSFFRLHVQGKHDAGRPGARRIEGPLDCRRARPLDRPRTDWHRGTVRLVPHFFEADDVLGPGQQPDLRGDGQRRAGDAAGVERVRAAAVRFGRPRAAARQPAHHRSRRRCRSTANLLAYNVGGGAVGFITDHTGVRFDLRYYSSLSRADETIALRTRTGSGTGPAPSGSSSAATDCRFCASGVYLRADAREHPHLLDPEERQALQITLHLGLARRLGLVAVRCRATRSSSRP